MRDDRIEEILDFWFDGCGSDPEKINDRMDFWFAGGADQDEVICERFGDVVAAASTGELDHWAATARGRLALILLLDQFRRNVHRGDAAAFEKDHVAEGLTLTGVESGIDGELSPIERCFFYMTLQHCEQLDVQDRSVKLYDALENDVADELRDRFKGFREFAVLHRDIVARFGRFPHRNRVLGREDTPEEAAYLADDAPTFGQ